ncbi:thioredoxin family protein [Mucilaginibacter aquatilis]|uniref:Thioredoxin fold domain-containing protein n=1 Tax=Mucilaginibacter aquatilis TaxID=1517760 RepID=A0A6I4I764_9SPHI|nr:thioredoxin domain-containing protein [Mucilaginibacter aquatilis]MVN91010.1 thioredoxin fold domain-containing protein [Mucilaginibacter aquatilis]
MKFLKCIWVVLILATSTVYAQNNNEIAFTATSWNEALKQAKAQNKPIFVDAYATWCGPCKMLKATTFKNKDAAKFYNANFINVALDMERGNNPKLAQQWGMRAYPTLIIFDSDGKILLNTVGFITAKNLLRFGEEGLRRQ